MKVVLYVFIISFTTYLGYLYNKKYENRFIFYKNYYDFIVKFSNNISFSNEKLKDFLQKNSSSFTDNLLRIKESSVETRFSYLNDIENADFKEFVNNLGKADSDSQINFLKSKEKEVFEKMNETKKENEKYKNLFVKIGFLIGLVIVISIL